MSTPESSPRRAAVAALLSAVAWITLRAAGSALAAPEATLWLLDLVMAGTIVGVTFLAARPRRSGSGSDPSATVAAKPPEPEARPPLQKERRDTESPTEVGDEGPLRRSHRLESIGEFTGAVAHDFNNLLTAIITPIQLLLADLPPAHPSRQQLEDVEDAATRGAALSRQLLAFSRKQVVAPSPHDLNEIVAGLEPMLRRLLGSAVTLQVLKEPSLGAVVVDVTQMEQVLVNLVVNARDAMSSGGLLTISTSAVDPARDRIRSEGPSTAPGYVVLEVRDTGHGFDEETRARIFEPYFTTKPHGTGLGLATVFGIARQSRGFVRVESAPGRGASFRVYLPATSVPAQPLSRRRDTTAGRADGGSELVLVVEDQEPVRQVLVRALTRFGYRVAQAGTVEEGLDRAAELGASLDLLLTDVMLPGGTGPDLAGGVREARPELPVIYVSGFADRQLFDEAGPDGKWEFLAKPFSVDDLLATVRRVLDRRAGNTGRKSG